MAKQGGFTLLELLLSLSIIGVLAGLSIPVYESFSRRNDLDIATQSTVSAIRRAASYSRAGVGDSAYSVRINDTSVVLFKGTSYATRDQSFDETLIIPDIITTGGLTDIQFAKLTGMPNTSGSITLSTTTSDTRTITINAKGMVDY